MLIDNALFPRFAPLISALPERRFYARADLLSPTFRLHQDGNLEIYYVPLEYLNERARIAFIGITPGWSQLEIAYRAARAGLTRGLTPSEITLFVDQQASFAGPICSTLCDMLDRLEIPALLGIQSGLDLFGAANDLLHTTALVRYSVFVKGQNYTGHNPNLLKTPNLRRYVEDSLSGELRRMPQALVVPMGTAVADALRLLIDAGQLDPARCLLGFPHPSGANMHRAGQFAGVQHKLKAIARQWLAR
ncbi:MAG TPA: hypothetical protein VGS80_26775 [Ktedonobacterales bacterium]|nr:hypothetical protein [Ktedonobacterales bacterium]